MTRLILTNDPSAAGSLKVAGLADLVIPIDLVLPLERRLIWGRFPSDEQLAAFFTARTTQEQGLHWQDCGPKWRLDRFGVTGLGLAEVCMTSASVELWIDAEPKAQLLLLWLLDYFRLHEETVPKLTLVQADLRIGEQAPEDLAAWRLPAIPIFNDHLELGCVAWQAYRAPTPQDCFNLLTGDLGVLPRLRQAVVQLLEELPWHATGLGATEMVVLELIGRGGTHPSHVFTEVLSGRRVLEYWELGALLDGLAHCPAPAIAGLDEGPFTLEMHDNRERYKRYKQSRLSLTPLGEAILAGRDDFSRHNPIHRWWGGTELTNESLWRWDSAKRALIAP